MKNLAIAGLLAIALGIPAVTASVAAPAGHVTATEQLNDTIEVGRGMGMGKGGDHRHPSGNRHSDRESRRHSDRNSRANRHLARDSTRHSQRDSNRHSDRESRRQRRR